MYMYIVKCQGSNHGLGVRAFA